MVKESTKPTTEKKKVQDKKGQSKSSGRFVAVIIFLLTIIFALLFRYL